MGRGRRSRALELRLLRWRIVIRDAVHLILTRNHLRVPLLLVAVIFGIGVGLQEFALGNRARAAAQTVLSVAEVMLGIYFSVELYAGLRPASTERIDRPEDVVAFYEEHDCAGDLLRMSDLPGWPADADLPNAVPGVLESVPSAPVPIGELEVAVREEYYPLPDRAERLYDPVLDELRDRFVEEGNFNQLKLRPSDFDEGTIESGTTTFFNNYATNLSPDADLYEHRTPRQLLQPLVCEDGQLRGLEDTPLPYIAASAGVVVAENGEAIFPIRSRDVVIEGMHLGLSFGGSWDADVVDTEGVTAQIAGELAEERAIPDSMDVSVSYLGSVRRLELLGKPDCLLVAICDGVPEWAVASREERQTVVARIVPPGVTVDGVEDLIEHSEAVTEHVAQLLQDSPFRPSPGLLYWLHVLDASGRPSDSGDV